MQFITWYMNIDSFCLCCYERLTCPVAVSVSAVRHEATCHCKSELYLLFPICKRGCEATSGKTGPDLYAQVEVVLVLYGLTVKTDTRTQNVLTRSAYQHPTNMAVLLHILSSSLMLCPSHGNPLPAQAPRETDWDFWLHLPKSKS